MRERARINRERYAAAMARKDINGTQLMALTGLSRGTVTSVKSGKSVAKETADKLVAVLGKDILEGGKKNV